MCLYGPGLRSGDFGYAERAAPGDWSAEDQRFSGGDVDGRHHPPFMGRDRLRRAWVGQAKEPWVIMCSAEMVSSTGAPMLQVP